MSKTVPDYGAWLRAEVQKISSASDGPDISIPIGCAIMWGADRIATAIERHAVALEASRPNSDEN